MAVFVLEDLESAVEVTMFPRTYVEHGYKLADDLVVAVRGRLDRRDDTRTGIFCQSIEVLTGLAIGPASPLTLRLPPSALDDLRIHRLKRILREHPGDSIVMLELDDRTLRLPDEFRVDVGRAVGELRMTFGHDAVVC